MATELQQGMRRYTCLVPIVVQEGGRPVEYRHIHLIPVTRRVQREWEDGLIQGQHGALEALIARLTFEPYYVLEEMQHPDVELFNREFLTHLPPVMSSAIARGEMPAPAPVDPYDDTPDGGVPPQAPYVPPTPPPGPAPAPRSPMAPEPAYVGPDTPTEAMDGANFELAQMGPDESLGSPEQQARAAAAFSVRREGGEDAGQFSRDMTAEAPAGADNALARAVRRAGSDPAVRPAWQASPRDPFSPEPAPEKASRNRPPTGQVAGAVVSAEQQAAPRQGPPAAATGREPIYDPGPAYVPDMSAAGYEEPKPNAFGIGDMR